MIAMGTLISHGVELEPGSNFPGLDRALCMANCLKAYNTCMGREDGGGEGEPEEDGGIDQPDDPDDDGGLEGLGCYMAYASCLTGCTLQRVAEWMHCGFRASRVQGPAGPRGQGLPWPNRSVPLVPHHDRRAGA